MAVKCYAREIEQVKLESFIGSLIDLRIRLGRSISSYEVRFHARVSGCEIADIDNVLMRVNDDSSVECTIVRKRLKEEENVAARSRASKLAGYLTLVLIIVLISAFFALKAYVRMSGQ